MKKLFVLFFLVLGAAHAAVDPSEKSPRFLVHILNYIAADYPGAVENGAVISQSEYQEQLDFAAVAAEIAREVPELKLQPHIFQATGKLLSLVETKASAAEVQLTAREAQQMVLKLGSLQVAPSQWPNRHAGKSTYEKSCASCHGAGGHGDGPSGGSLDPLPTNFHDAKLNDISPFQMYLTIRLGVPGTGMAAFSTLTDTEVWDLAFYLSALRHSAVAPDTATANEVGLPQVASLSDNELKKSFHLTNAQTAELRLREVGTSGDKTLLLFTENQLQQSLEKFKAGQFDLAKSHAIAAYLEGIEPIEPRLRSRNSTLTIQIEQQMSELRSKIDRRVEVSSFEETVVKTNQLLKEVESLLAEKQGSALLTFSVASGIFLREAFEATLLLITLLGVIRSLGIPSAAKYVHAGWLTAVGVGIVAWFLSGWLMVMSGAQREMLEGVISLFAVCILLYFGFWLHRRTEIGKWHAFINDLVKSAIDKKNLMALGVVAFMGVFREAFETVLFLRALLLESGPGQEWALGLGVGLSFILVVILSTIAVRSSARIPVRKLFMFSSVIMVLLAFILLGKSVHAFQETGILSITLVPIPFRVDILGIYPTVETILPQVILLLISGSLFILGRRTSRTGLKQVA